jgi:spermidine synthase
MNAPRFLPVLLAFCMFSTGASGLVNEYVLATITTYILGNSIENFSMVIACMMLMMGVSGFVQNKMSDNNLLQKFIAVEVIMALMGGFAPLVIYAAFGYLEHSFQIVHYFFVLSVGFLIGFEIPLVMRIIEQHKIKLKTNLTIVYAMDYVGAFVGAAIWVKFLLKNFPLTEISFIVAGFNFIVAALTIVYFLNQKIIKKPLLQIIILLITAALLIFGFNQNRDISNLLEQRFYDDPIVHKVTTRYQHIVITHNQQLNDTRLYINGNTQFSSTDEARYHDLLVHPVMAIADKLEHVLVLGGGDGLALREINKYRNIKTVTLVDLDPQMVELASTDPRLTKLNHNAFAQASVKHGTFIQNQFNQNQSSQSQQTNHKQGIYLAEPYSNNQDEQWIASVDVFNVDADQFLRQLPTKVFDAVIIDLPDPSSIELSKLYSKQFYLSLKKHLSQSAFIAIQSTSPFHAKPAYLAIGSTLQAAGYSVLPYRQNIPSFGDWGFYIAWTQKVMPEDIKQKLQNIERFAVQTDFITPELLAASFAFGKGELDIKEPCINTLMQPCLLHHYNDKSWVNE